MKKLYKGDNDSDRLAFLGRSVKELLKRLFYFLWYHIHRRTKKPVTGVKTIEFICNGNICRSAFAEKYSSRLLAKKGYSIKSSSSGVWAKDGTRSPAEAIRAASVFNVDLCNHMSIKTDDSRLNKADLIFCMHFNQYRQLCRKFPAHKEKIFLLKAYNKRICFDMNIDDPYGKSVQQYHKCFKEISRSIEMALEKITKSSAE
jgi:protein-tyrosine phosphatase